MSGSSCDSATGKVQQQLSGENSAVAEARQEWCSCNGASGNDERDEEGRTNLEIMCSVLFLV